MNVVVGGGSGFIGRHLVQSLAKKGYEVTVVSRTAGAGKITWMDLDRQGLPANCVAVVNLAGRGLMDPMKRWNESFQEEVRSSRIDTTRQLVRAIMNSSAKPKVWIGTSAVGFYKPSSTAEYTETSEGGDFDFASRLCRDWEAAAQVPEKSGVRQVIIRIGLVMGHGGGLIQNMYMPFFLGLGGRIASGQQWFPWIHMDDVVGIITHAIQNENVTGILNAVSPEPATNADFTQNFARAMWRPAIFPVPGFVLNTVFGAERATMMLEGQKVIPQRTLESGYKFVYPDLKSACEDCAKWRST